MRAELFSIQRLEQHAASLAAAQQVAERQLPRESLRARLRANESVLLASYRAIAAAADEGRTISPAAEWLLDNYHLVEEQIREIRQDLPPSFYRGLPKLDSGPLQGYPRVLGVAWAFVAHTDSRFDPESLRCFVRAYQRVQPLTIGELWAVAITLRIVLVENLRRTAARIVSSRAARQEADVLADRLLGVNGAAFEPDALLRRDAEGGRFSPAFAVQLLQRLRDQDPQVTPGLHRLEELLAAQGTTADEIVRDEHQRQGASNVTVRNLITSMRALSDVDWPEFFESVSLVDDLLRSGSDFCASDFPTRDLYRRAIERFARGSKLTELEVAAAALAAAHESDSRHGGAADGRCSDPGYYLIADGRRAFAKTIGYRDPRFSWPSSFEPTPGVGTYVGTIALVAGVALSLPLVLLHAWSVAGAELALLACLGLISALRCGRRAGESRRDASVRRNDPAGSRLTRRHPVGYANDGGRSRFAHDARRTRSPDRSPRDSLPRLAGRRAVLRVAVGLDRCPDREHGRRRSAARRRRGEAIARLNTSAWQRLRPATASCCCIVGGSGTTGRNSGWAGNASAASCTN